MKTYLTNEEKLIQKHIDQGILKKSIVCEKCEKHLQHVMISDIEIEGDHKWVRLTTQR